jgi:5-hydroxyisourate hydrolase-like protein (transthyretin family)
MIPCVLWLMMFGWMPGQQTSRLPSERPQANSVAAAHYRVAGVVIDSVSGQPLAQATMSLEALESMNRGADDEVTTLTDGDGHFAFENLAAGHYVLWGHRKGYGEQRYKQHGSFSTGIVLGEELSADNLRFEMTPDASIIGEVTDEMSEPVRQAHIRLVREGRMNGRRRNVVIREAVTDDQGRYRVDHLGSGTYVIVVTATPWYADSAGRARTAANSKGRSELHAEDANTDVTYPVTYFPSALDFAAATPIVLHPGETATANVSIAPVPAVHFTFRKYTNDPEEQTSLTSITRTIADGVPEMVFYQARESDGVVEILSLPPGNLDFDWTVTKGGEVRKRSQTMHFGNSGQVESAEDDAPSMATVHGTIQLDPRLHLQNPLITLRNTLTGKEERARAEEDGKFDFLREFAAGTYEFSIPRAPEASLVIAASGAKTAGTTIEISAGQSVELKIFASMSTGQVTGVTMEEGKPVDGVMVLLVPADFEHETSMMRIDQSDSDGSFTLARVVPGRYTVLGIENAWKAEWSSADFLRKFLAGGQVVDVGADAKVKVNVKVQKNTTSPD